MRFHFWQYISNEEGQPVNSVDISVYIAGSSTPAYIYTSENGGSASNTVPQITTDENGFFEFWIADSSETNGYDSGKFKIVWEKAGVIDTGYIDNVDIIIPSFDSKADVYSTLVGSTISSEVLKLTDEGSSVYSCSIIHNLNNAFPLFVSYTDSAKKTEAVSANIYFLSIDENSGVYYRNTDVDTYITLIG